MVLISMSEAAGQIWISFAPPESKMTPSASLESLQIHYSITEIRLRLSFITNQHHLLVSLLPLANHYTLCFALVCLPVKGGY